MSCLFTLIFTQKGVSQHPELLCQDGINELEPGAVQPGGAGLAAGDSAMAAGDSAIPARDPGSRGSVCAHPAPPLTAERHHCVQCAHI